MNPAFPNGIGKSYSPIKLVASQSHWTTGTLDECHRRYATFKFGDAGFRRQILSRPPIVASGEETRSNCYGWIARRAEIGDELRRALVVRLQTRRISIAFSSSPMLDY
jgi:hypothetical protein